MLKNPHKSCSIGTIFPTTLCTASLNPKRLVAYATHTAANAATTHPIGQVRAVSIGQSEESPPVIIGINQDRLLKITDKVFNPIPNGHVASPILDTTTANVLNIATT